MAGSENLVNQPQRGRHAGMAALLSGLAFFVGGFGLVASLRYGSALGLQGPGEGLSYALAAGGLVTAWFGIRLMVRGRKMRSVDGDTAIARSASGPFLYLRSFSLDEADAQHGLPVWAGLSVPINPWESSIAQGFSGAGPLVAIGRPGERFATTGASRVYVSDDEWQDKVLELSEQAELIIWVYGETGGLRWEIGQLTGRLPPEKLVLALPVWKMRASERQAYWKTVADSIGASFPQPLPEHIGTALFIAFDKDWQAQPIDPEPPPLLLRLGTLGGWNHMTWGIRALLDQRGIARYRPGKAAIILSLLGALIWMLLFCLVAVLGYGLIQAFL